VLCKEAFKIPGPLNRRLTQQTIRRTQPPAFKPPWSENCTGQISKTNYLTGDTECASSFRCHPASFSSGQISPLFSSPCSSQEPNPSDVCPFVKAIMSKHREEERHAARTRLAEQRMRTSRLGSPRELPVPLDWTFMPHIRPLPRSLGPAGRGLGGHMGRWTEGCVAQPCAKRCQCGPGRAGPGRACRSPVVRRIAGRRQLGM
jgi:hypothetical protein